jgi:hypothetical protein
MNLFLFLFSPWWFLQNEEPVNKLRDMYHAFQSGNFATIIERKEQTPVSRPYPELLDKNPQENYNV